MATVKNQEQILTKKAAYGWMMKLKSLTWFVCDATLPVEVTSMMKMPDKGDSFLLETFSVKAIHPHSDTVSESRLLTLKHSNLSKYWCQHQ